MQREIVAHGEPLADFMEMLTAAGKVMLLTVDEIEQRWGLDAADR